MQTLYDNGFGENCALAILTGVGATIFASLVVSAIFWMFARARPGLRPYVAAPAGVGVVVGVGFGVAMWFHDESLMSVAIDVAFL
jgi:hypothetical protein